MSRMREFPGPQQDDFGFLDFVVENPISRAVGGAAKSALEVARDAARAVLGTLPGGLGASVEEVVLRAQGSGMYFALVPFLGPQGASVAFAWPGVFRGEAFDKAWFQETLWRSEQALAMSGGDQKLVEAINKQTADGLAKLAGKFSQESIARMGINEIKQHAQVSRDDVALAIKALADRSERTMAELKATVSSPAFNVQTGTVGAATGGGVLFTADQVVIPGGSNRPAIRRVGRAPSLPGGSTGFTIRRVGSIGTYGPVLAAKEAAAMLEALGFMTSVQRSLATEGTVSGGASSPLGKFLASIGQDPRVVAAATLNGPTSDMLRNAYNQHVTNAGAIAQAREDKRATVGTIQQILAALGYNVAVDGFQGPQTLAAIKMFQASAGLAADGKVGPLTEAALVTTYQRKMEEAQAMQVAQDPRLMSEQLAAFPELARPPSEPLSRMTDEAQRQAMADPVYQAQMAAYNAQVAQQMAQTQAASKPAASPVPAVAIGGGVGLGVALAAGLAAPIALPVAAVGGLLGWLVSRK